MSEGFRSSFALEKASSLGSLGRRSSCEGGSSDGDPKLDLIVPCMTSVLDGINRRFHASTNVLFAIGKQWGSLYKLEIGVILKVDSLRRPPRD